MFSVGKPPDELRQTPDVPGVLGLVSGVETKPKEAAQGSLRAPEGQRTGAPVPPKGTKRGVQAAPQTWVPQGWSLPRRRPRCGPLASF